jgi:hypothetical protein
MDLPPSGWYPDPYGTPDLLRWWDGSAWSHHTHQEGAGAGGGSGLQATSAAPTTGALNRAEPPTGPPTSPQPALPATTVQAAVQSSVQPTAYQPAATRVQAPVQPAAYQPAAFQSGGYQSGGYQSGSFQSGGYQSGAPQPGAGGGGDGTQVLFLGNDAWQTPGGPGTAGYGYGYQEAQRRRRRMWLMGGLGAGTAVAVAVIAVIVAGLGSSPASPAADQTPVAPSTPAAAAASPPPTPTPTPSASASTSAPAATLSDGQSGLSYTELSSPWQPTCPTDLNNGAFTWTSGESAIAGQVNGGQTAWYGEACAGPLPQQYGYTGVSDLENTATNLATTFGGAYYNALAHTAAEGVSQPVTISGHAGWEFTYEITYTNAQAQGVTWADEQAAVVVVDTGTGGTPAVFFTSIPTNLGESNVASLVSSLQLSVVPQASSTPTDGGSPNP